MRTSIVAGNWKMNGDRVFARQLVEEIQTSLAGLDLECIALVCPSFVHLGLLGQQINGSSLKLGAQDVDHRDAGAFTGAVAASMLKTAGCEYVIVGHSERRIHFSESDELVADKVAQCLKYELTPIMCVGETIKERKASETLQVVTRQLKALLNKTSVEDLTKVVFAYEPVWAIGTGESATPDQAEEVHASLRETLTDVDAGLGENASILYGGSVSPQNAASLFAMKNIDGALVGGAALKAESFVEICKAADEIG